MKDTKREMTIEELEEKYAKITEECQNIEKILRQKKQEEKDRRIAQLALEKERRKKEVDEALDNYRTLAGAYIHDYGSYSTITTSSNSNHLLDNLWPWWI
jgi:DNA repair exonuclease SbcCD ATPase subunit